MGPNNRDYSFNLNKKERKLALKSALSSKFMENKILIIDTFKIDSHKTKDLNNSLKNLHIILHFLFTLRELIKILN